MNRIVLDRVEAQALFYLSHTNLLDSKFEVVRPTDEDLLYITVTSPTVPTARTMWEIKRNGERIKIIEEGVLEGLLRQDTDS